MEPSNSNNKKEKTSLSSQQRDQLEGEPSICSLKDLQVQIPTDIRDHLAQQYSSHNNPNQHVDQIIHAMKLPPATTVCRVNLIQGTREDIQRDLEAELLRQELQDTFVVEKDPYFHDVLHVKNCTEPSTSQVDLTGPIPDDTLEEVFPTWPSRKDLGWPLYHRAVIVDRFCGEAVLRGSHIFVKGIMCADKGIQASETIAVYADVRSTISKNKRLKRGYFIEQYRNRLCVYLGLGTSLVPRNDYFNQDKGVGIRMSLIPKERVGPMLPPLSGILPSKLYFQNLPSILVAHALAPQPGDVIIDMCAAPGGKTSHIASLIQNNDAVIVACDKSRTKMIQAQQMFAEMGATCITALALNTTACVLEPKSNTTGSGISANDDRYPTVQEILESSSKADDGLLNVTGFYPESFDRVLLDPPCSALGLRPKLQVIHTTLQDLQQACTYQKKFIRQAVMLLKPGGIMTYSTCTFLADENERIVHYMLTEYPILELLPVLGDDCDSNINVTVQIGQPGLPGMGLSDKERGCVRRFDPCPEDASTDTIGFFVAKFRKRREDGGRNSL